MRTAAVNPSPSLVERPNGPAVTASKGLAQTASGPATTQVTADAALAQERDDGAALPLYEAAPELFGGFPVLPATAEPPPQTTAAAASKPLPQPEEVAAAATTAKLADDGKALPLYEAAPELFGGFPLTPPPLAAPAPPAGAPASLGAPATQLREQQHNPTSLASTVVTPPTPPVVLPMPFTASNSGRAGGSPPPAATLGHGLPAAAPIPTPMRATGEFNTAFAGATPLAPPRLTKATLEAASSAAAAASAPAAAVASAPQSNMRAAPPVALPYVSLPVRVPTPPPVASNSFGTPYASGVGTPYANSGTPYANSGSGIGFRAMVPPSPAHAASTTYLPTGSYQEMILPLEEAAPELFGRDPAAATPLYTAVRSGVANNIPTPSSGVRGMPSPAGSLFAAGRAGGAAPSPWSMASMASQYYPPTPANTTVSGSNLVMQQSQQQYLQQFQQQPYQQQQQPQPPLQQKQQLPQRQQQQQLPRSWGPNNTATQQWLANQMPGRQQQQQAGTPLDTPEGAATRTPASVASAATSTSASSTAPVSRPVLERSTPQSLREASELSSRSRSRSPAYRALDTPAPSRGRFTGFEGSAPFNNNGSMSPPAQSVLVPTPKQPPAVAKAAGVATRIQPPYAGQTYAAGQAGFQQGQGPLGLPADATNAPPGDQKSESGADLSSSALSQPKKTRNARRNAARRLQKKTMTAAMAAQRHKATAAMNLVAVQKSTPPLPLAAAQPSALSEMAYKMLRPAAETRVVYETPEPAGVGRRDNETEPPFAHI